MPRFDDDRPQGVIPACLLPFKDDLGIDEAAYRKHLRDVVSVPGLTAITVNAHASEVASCTFDEQKRVLDITMDEVGDGTAVVNGVYADGSQEAARIARMAEAGGAAALLVFPPQPFIMGARHRPEMALAHFQCIAEACGLPMIVFQYPMASGQGYPLDTLVRMTEEVPTIRAIKDWCNDAALHERHIRTLHGLARPINVLSTHSSWLMSSLVLGCDGLLSGSGSVIADLQAALWRAVCDDDLARALPVLIEHASLKRNSPYLVMLALNAIDALDDRARGALDSVNALPQKDSSVPARMKANIPKLMEKILADLEP